MDDKRIEEILINKKKKRKRKIIISLSVLLLIVVAIIFHPVIETSDERFIGSLNYIENLNTQERIDEFEKAAKYSISFDYNNWNKKKNYNECLSLNSDTRYVLSLYNRWFPVMKDNDGYYDRKDFNKRNDPIGTPYIYESDNYKIIFGHSVWGHQFDLMFTFLEQYTQKDFWKENRVISLDGEKGIENYLVVSVVNLDINEDPWSGWLTASPIMEDFTKWVKESATVTYDDNFNSNDEYLVLCTCDITQANARYLIVSKKV